MIQKSHHTYSCYTSSIAKILKFYNINLTEENLFCSEKLLELKCSTKNDGLYTNLESLTDAYLNCYGIVIRSIKLQHHNDLNSLIKTYGRLLLKIDCKNLTYAKIFENAFTVQRKHYVIVTNIMDSYIEIIDSYIPTTPSTMYKGKLNLAKENLIGLEFKYIDIYERKKYVAINKLSLIDHMIQGYFINVDEAYGQFISNLKGIGFTNGNKENGKILVYEMATALSVSGTIASRRVFCRLLKEIELIPETLFFELSSIEFKYNALRLLLLKCYVNLNQENIECVIEKVYKIKEFEVEKYKKVCSIIEKVL